MIQSAHKPSSVIYACKSAYASLVIVVVVVVEIVFVVLLIIDNTNGTQLYRTRDRS